MFFLRLPAWVSLLLTMPCWIACQQSASTEQAAATAPPPQSQTTYPATLAQRFGPLLRGSWVNADYLAHVRKSHSPQLAFDYTGEISEFSISLAKQSADSLVVGLGLGNHEGGNLTIYFRSGLQPNSLPTNWPDYEEPGNVSEISCQVGPRDTTLVLTTYSRDRKVVRRVSYERVPGVAADEIVALNRAVNTVLFAGRYTGQDSVGRPVQIQFTPDGRVQGLPGATSYDTSTDFGGGPGNDIDNVTFSNAARADRTIHFTRNADTLRLYSTTLLEPVDDAPTLTRGHLLYRLVRQR
ncbi:hypothetical protein [Hymenobacter metallicola]|uniref:Uncharacterized protein n=1 Tax=Hymenobacter metallicola TaxID=2563114 RepID=A0A4Z0QER6_9BACT|nr:hypothetical protein [Hymenobacter metallicola]TGE28537.1 hypothetical protein E5K02_03460 [Hymenobacter metallicola]